MLDQLKVDLVNNFQPKLVLDPPPPNPAAPGVKLDPAALTSLRTLMRDVVTSGTGTGLRTVPGSPVYGKTGTAEFDTGSNDTHAWFIGWQNDLAFAVMVQKGGAGSWTTIQTVKVSTKTGYFDIHSKLPYSGNLRLSYTYPQTETLLPTNVAGSTITSRTVKVAVS